MFTLLVIACPLHFFAGWLIGRTMERLAWNQLIKDGILPTPKRKG